jgi:hypothetical protein
MLLVGHRNVIAGRVARSAIGARQIGAVCGHARLRSDRERPASPAIPVCGTFSCVSVPIGDNAVAAGSIGVNNLIDTALTFGVSALDAGGHGAIVVQFLRRPAEQISHGPMGCFDPVRSPDAERRC